MEWDKVKARIEERGSICNHTQGHRLRIQGVKMGCCNGSGSVCKQSEIRFLMNLLREKTNQVDTLEKQVTHLQNRPTSVTHTINNSYTMNVVNLNGTDLVRQALRGHNPYKLAFEQLMKLPDSDEKQELLLLGKSLDPCDGINYKREVMNLVWDAVEADVAIGKLQNDDFKIITDVIDAEQDRITAQAIQLGMDGEK